MKLRIAALALLILCVSQLPAAADGSAKVTRKGRHGSSGVAASAYIHRMKSGSPDDGSSITTVSSDPAIEITGSPEISTSFASGAGSLGPAPCLRRRVGGNWGSALSFCVDAGRPPRRRGAPRVSPEAVARILADRALALAPDPRIEIAPERVGVTGLETFFWVDPPAPVTATARVAGLVVVAQARAVQWGWDFGDGTDVVSSDPGRPWTAAHAGSIAHTYETDGSFELVAEQVWEARWRIGNGAWRHLGYFSNSASRPYPVREVVSFLVRDR